MRFALLIVFVFACVGCTNVYTIGPAPRMRGLTGLVVSALWSTTTRVDDRSATPDELAMQAQRRAEQDRADALRTRCIDRVVARAYASEDAVVTAADARLDQRCAVIGY